VADFLILLFVTNGGAENQQLSRAEKKWGRAKKEM
jgi:hypothetical protein